MSESLIQIGAEGGGLARPMGRSPKPEWLKIKLKTSPRYHQIKNLLQAQHLNTVCEEARCPNIYECWGEYGTATFMILGDICTRQCGFCAVKTGRPEAGVDPDEPRRLAETVSVMGLRHAVITSVDRDDLPDGGAQHFVEVIEALRDLNPDTAVEVLTPDFRGSAKSLEMVLRARPEVFAHNMETVPRLYGVARPGSRYDRSLGLLSGAADRLRSGEYSGRVKTGIMVGLGESTAELHQTIQDIAGAGVEILTIGQYLQPTTDHLAVDRWVHPDEFARYREFALSLGLRHCEAGPLVRSSYRAHEHVGSELAPATSI